MSFQVFASYFVIKRRRGELRASFTLWWMCGRYTYIIMLLQCFSHLLCFVLFGSYYAWPSCSSHSRYDFIIFYTVLLLRVEFMLILPLDNLTLYGDNAASVFGIFCWHSRRAFGAFEKERQLISLKEYDKRKYSIKFPKPNICIIIDFIWEGANCRALRNGWVVAVVIELMVDWMALRLYQYFGGAKWNVPSRSFYPSTHNT